jgi:hypothetical protein
VNSTSQDTIFTTDIIATVGFELATAARICQHTKFLERMAYGIVDITVCAQ